MAGKVKINEVILQSPNGLIEKTIALTNNGNVTIDSIYPVGSIYISTVGTNPSNYFGGTWVAFGSGKTLVGIDIAQTEFNTIEKTGGEKTHQLTVGELAFHTHDWMPIHSVAGAGSYYASSAGYSANLSTTGAGGNQPHNNLQPYIVTYMWKRTA